MTLAQQDGRTRRANAIREQRRAYILESALQVFGERGYHQTRVADIIAAAGIARGTFYIYFESKNAIFLELLTGLIKDLRASVVGVSMSAGSAPFKEQLVASIRRVLQTFSERRALTAILLRQAVGLDEEVDRRMEEFYDNLHRFLVLSLANGQRLGLVRDEVDQGIAATCILGAVQKVVEREVLGSEVASDFDAERVARAIIDATGSGVLS